MVSLRLDLEGASNLTIAAMTTTFFAGLLVGALRAPPIVQRIGHIRAFAGLAGLLSAATLAQGLVGALGVWLAARFVTGLCIAGLFLVAESWLNAVSSPTGRGTLLGAYMAVYYLALGGGQLLVPWVDVAELHAFAVAALLISLAAVPLATTRAEAPHLPPARWFGTRELLDIAPLGVAGTVVAGLVLGGFYGLGPVYARAVLGSTDAASRFMGIAVAGGLLLQWPVGALSDRFDRRTVLVGIAWALLAVSLGVLVVGPIVAEAGVLVAGALFGGVAATLYPLALSHAADRVPAERWMGANATLVVLSGLSSAVGPLLYALAMDAFGPWGLFGAMGATAAVLGLLGIRQLGARDSLPPAAQADHVAGPRTLTVLPELDPRTDALPLADDGPVLDG